MKYAITLDPSIAKRNAWTGTRRREATFADGSKKLLVFSRKPVVLDELPPEIANDPKLLVKEIPGEAFDEGILDMPTPAPAHAAHAKPHAGRFTAKGKK